MENKVFRFLRINLTLSYFVITFNSFNDPYSIKRNQFGLVRSQFIGVVENTGVKLLLGQQ